MGTAAEDLALRFAATLDASDWAAATALLAPDCVYACRGQRTVGAAAIVQTYRTIGEWVDQTFETVRYESKVDALPDGVALISFRDRLDHGEHHLDFRCQQRITAGPRGLIAHIEHIDLPGELEKAARFNQACGVSRP